MKRLLSLLAAMLLCFLAYSQEAESVGSTAELSIIPHLEMLPDFTNGEAGFNCGNSSLFTDFSGRASELFSWTLINNWATIPYEPDSFGDKYRNVGRSDTGDFILFARGDFHFGNFDISLGKDCMALGGFEYDDWDWDVQANFATPLWSSLACYQWGAKLAWTTPSEMTNLSLQMVSSPFGEYPFASGLYSYSGQWRGEYGWFSNIWSVSAVGYDKGRFDWLFCLGQRATFDKWMITVDYNNNCGLVVEELNPASESRAFTHFAKGTTVAGDVNYAPADWVDVSAKGM